MVSTEGLVPITRAFLASYYDKYPFTPLSDDVSRLSLQIYAMATTDLLKDSPPAQGESSLIREAESEPPHKVDENMWKNREQIEEILFLLEAPHTSNCCVPEDAGALTARFALKMCHLLSLYYDAWKLVYFFLLSGVFNTSNETKFEKEAPENI